MSTDIEQAKAEAVEMLKATPCVAGAEAFIEVNVHVRYKSLALTEEGRAIAGRAIRARIYETERAIMDKFPGVTFDFYVMEAHDGQPAPVNP